MKTAVTVVIDTDDLRSLEDRALAAYWHVAQINPAPFGDPDACKLADDLRAEILRRWLQAAPVDIFSHQGHHVSLAKRLAADGGAA